MSETNWGRRKYRTTNWKAYNAALKARGDLTIWLDRDMQWLAVPSGKRGRSQTFSDAAIESPVVRAPSHSTPMESLVLRSWAPRRATHYTTDCIGRK